MTSVTHLIAFEGDSMRTACGEAGDEPNWTTLVEAATCPACLRRVRDGTRGDGTRQRRRADSRAHA